MAIRAETSSKSPGAPLRWLGGARLQPSGSPGSQHAPGHCLGAAAGRPCPFPEVVRPRPAGPEPGRRSAPADASARPGRGRGETRRGPQAVLVRAPAPGEGGAPRGPQPDPPPRPRSPREPVRTCFRRTRRRGLDTPGAGLLPTPGSKLSTPAPGGSGWRSCRKLPAPLASRRARGLTDAEPEARGRPTGPSCLAGAARPSRPWAPQRVSASSRRASWSPFLCQQIPPGGPGGDRSAVVCRGRCARPHPRGGRAPRGPGPGASPPRPRPLSPGPTPVAGRPPTRRPARGSRGSLDRFRAKQRPREKSTNRGKKKKEKERERKEEGGEGSGTHSGWGAGGGGGRAGVGLQRRRARSAAAAWGCGRRGVNGNLTASCLLFPSGVGV